MEKVIAKAIKLDRPVIINTKNGQEYMGWVIERHTDEEMVYISPGFGVPFEDIANVSVPEPEKR